MSLPFRITTRTGHKYRTSHGLTSCQRAQTIDVYDSLGNQTTVYVSDIRKHSAGSMKTPVGDPIPVESCAYCGHVGQPVLQTDQWPSCASCGGI